MEEILEELVKEIREAEEEVRELEAERYPRVGRNFLSKQIEKLLDTASYRESKKMELDRIGFDPAQTKTRAALEYLLYLLDSKIDGIMSAGEEEGIACLIGDLNNYGIAGDWTLSECSAARKYARSYGQKEKFNQMIANVGLTQGGFTL